MNIYCHILLIAFLIDISTAALSSVDVTIVQCLFTGWNFVQYVYPRHPANVLTLWPSKVSWRSMSMHNYNFIVIMFIRHGANKPSTSESNIQTANQRGYQEWLKKALSLQRCHCFCAHSWTQLKKESCAIAKMTAWCVDKSKQPHLYLRSRDSQLTQFNQTLCM